MRDIELTCEGACRLMSPAVDGALSPEEEAALHLHCERCPKCQQEFASLRRVIQAVRTLPALKASEGLAVAVRARLNRRGEGVARLRGEVWKIALAAGLALAVGLSALKWKMSQQVQTRQAWGEGEYGRNGLRVPEGVSIGKDFVREQAQAESEGQEVPHSEQGVAKFAAPVCEPWAATPEVVKADGGRADEGRAVSAGKRSVPAAARRAELFQRGTAASHTQGALVADGALRSAATTPAASKPGVDEENGSRGRSWLESPPAPSGAPARPAPDGILTVRVTGIRPEDLQTLLRTSLEGERGKGIAKQPPEPGTPASDLSSEGRRPPKAGDNAVEQQEGGDGPLEWRLVLSGERCVQFIERLRQLAGTAVEIEEAGEIKALKSSQAVSLRIILKSP